MFLLPNTTTPIAVTNNATLTGLNSGTYQVTATQTLGPDSGSQQQNITITNAIQNMAYTISGVRPICGNNGVLTVNVNWETQLLIKLLQDQLLRMFKVQMYLIIYLLDNIK